MNDREDDIPEKQGKDSLSHQEDKSSKRLAKTWEAGSSGENLPTLFLPDELDIFVNKITLESYIFHGKEIDYEGIKHLEYDPADHSVDVVKKDGTRYDLGVKVQWLVRPYFTKSKEINIVRTENRKSVDGIVVPLIHKEKVR